MTTTERGKLYIETDDNNNHRIIFEPVNGNIWVYKQELPRLFGVYIQTINTHIEAIYKTKAFRETDTSKYDLYVSGNAVKYNKREFNLEIIVALAFRINSWQAKIIREWFINKFLKGSLMIIHPFDDNKQNYLLN